MTFSIGKEEVRSQHVNYVKTMIVNLKNSRQPAEKL